MERTITLIAQLSELEAIQEAFERGRATLLHEFELLPNNEVRVKFKVVNDEYKLVPVFSNSAASPQSVPESST